MPKISNIHVIMYELYKLYGINGKHKMISDIKKNRVIVIFGGREVKPNFLRTQNAHADI